MSAVKRALGVGSLERRLPLLISAVITIVVAVYCAASYREMRTTAYEGARLKLEAMSHELSKNNQDLGPLGPLKTHPAVTGYLAGTAPRAAIEKKLDSLFKAADTLTVGYEVRSTSGDRFVRAGSSILPIDESRLDAATRAALGSGKAGRSAFYATRGHLFTWSVAPVRRDTTVLGVVAELRRLDSQPRAEKQIQQIAGENIRVRIANETGDVWGNLLGTPIPPAFDVQNLTRPRRVIENGSPALAARAVIPGSPWILVLTLAESDVLRRPREFLTWMLTVGLGLALLGAFAAYYLGRYVTRPLLTVIGASERLAAGDYSSRVSLQRNDEIGRLGVSFNDMADRVRESHDALRDRVTQSAQLAKELEQRNKALNSAHDMIVRAVMRTDRLQAFTAALAGALDVDSVAAILTSRLVDSADARAAFIFLLDDTGQSLRLVHTHGYPNPERWATISLTGHSVGPASDAVNSATPVYLGNKDDWQDRYKVEAPESPIGTVAWASIPLLVGKRTLGVLVLSYPEEQNFDSDTRAYLYSIAQQCAQAIDRALLFQSVLDSRQASEQAQKLAQAANAAKSSFLAMMSHELRTPLNSISGYAELMEIGLHGPLTEEQREDLRRIKMNQKHLLSVITDILTMSSLDAGHLSLNISAVPVSEIVTDLESLLGPAIEQRGLHFDIRPCPEVAVRADAERVRQILVNLLANAIRFTDRGGQIRLSCTVRSDVVYLTVSDTGRGIPADKIDVIFERFVQVESGLTRRSDGSGLGLAISRELAQIMDGTITAESEMGRGSSFHLQLPRAPAMVHAGVAG